MTNIPICSNGHIQILRWKSLLQTFRVGWGHGEEGWGGGGGGGAGGGGVGWKVVKVLMTEYLLRVSSSFDCGLRIAAQLSLTIVSFLGIYNSLNALKISALTQSCFGPLVCNMCDVRLLFTLPLPVTDRLWSVTVWLFLDIFVAMFSIT